MRARSSVYNYNILVVEVHIDVNLDSNLPSIITVDFAPATADLTPQLYRAKYYSRPQQKKKRGISFLDFQMMYHLHSGTKC